MVSPIGVLGVFRGLKSLRSLRLIRYFDLVLATLVWNSDFGFLSDFGPRVSDFRSPHNTALRKLSETRKLGVERRNL